MPSPAVATITTSPTLRQMSPTRPALTPQAAHRLLRGEIMPVVGCTEPAAIGYALRLLTQPRPHPVQPGRWRVILRISREALRNASTAVVPHLRVRGVRAAAAAGIASSANDFNIFAAVDLRRARAFLRASDWLEIVPVRRCGLYVQARLVGQPTSVTLAGRHDHIKQWMVAGRDRTPVANQMPRPPTLADIFRLARAWNPRLENLARDFLLRQVPAEPGHKLETQIARRITGRMTGFAHPVMTITGSGNQGIFIALPYRALLAKMGDAILPAVVFTLLAQVYLTAKHKRLSAECGIATKAAPALAAGLAFARGAGPAEVRRIFRDIPAQLAGLTCEGAEPACGRKARQAFRAVAPWLAAL